ncbi:PREDICTED: uncharacterized protein LOC105361662 [Ceratosolen solmsi marchali]|uniref:Uncharacterized protein LOC105361662 n=1 Tax=Ceratosolen solmsi marchali TaxID=326594 RepID=A0AAJ6YFQ5_9HYME|nr:PREDICTED: uncharacterized protein LOC105361662 [Ceratosolen solmsi marchali]
MKNDFTKPSDDLSNLTKIMHKKLVQNDVNIRYELLEAEKKLLSQIKQTRELERTLRDVKEIVVQDRNYFQNKILNNCSSIIRKRTTFFGNSGSFTYSDMERNSFTTELEVIKDSTNTQWTGLEKYVNELKDIHSKEASKINYSKIISY